MFQSPQMLMEQSNYLPYIIYKTLQQKIIGYGIGLGFSPL